MSHSATHKIKFDRKLFNETLSEINKCYKEWILKISPIKFTKGTNYNIENDFRLCCNDVENDKLQTVIEKVLKNIPDVYKDGTRDEEVIARVYKAVLIYHYQMNVLPEYLYRDPRYQTKKFKDPCYKQMVKTDKNLNELLTTIISGDAPWNSGVRKIILGLNGLEWSSAGKKRRTRTNKHIGGRNRKTKRHL